MSLIDFGAIKKLLNHDPDDEQQQLFREAVLMVLSRATSADSNIEPVEITAVQAVLKEVLDEDVSEADIRTAAASAVFESQPLEKYLSSVSRKISSTQRMVIIESLATVIRSDDLIRHFELDFFDRVANAMRATPSEIAGLRLAT